MNDALGTVAPDRQLLSRAGETIARLDAARRAPGAGRTLKTRLDEYVTEIQRLAGLLHRRGTCPG